MRRSTTGGRSVAGWGLGTAATSPVGGGEQQVQAPGGGSVARQGHAAGRARKKTLKPSRKRTLVSDLMQRYGANQRQACAVLRLSRSVYGYRSRARDARPQVQRIKEIATTRV